MSSPQGGPPARPLRLAGLALIAIAVIALVAGLISLFIGDDGDGASAPPPNATATATSPPATAPTGVTGETTAPPGSPGQPPPPPPTTPTVAPPPATGAPPPPPPPPPPTAEPVRVYNNSTIQGLAARAAEDFRRAGWTVVEISNYPGGIIPTSTVYFRPGTSEEAAARVLGNQFDLRIEPRFPGIEQASPGLIVIVTNDYGGK